MNRQYWIIVLAVIIVISSVVLTSSSLVFFSESLRVGDVDDDGEGEYTIRLYDARDHDIVYVTVSTWPYALDWQNQTHMQVSIWHQDVTHIDSLQITFQPALLSSSLDVYLRTPAGGPWNPIETSTDGWQQAFHFPNLGLVGSGTVTLEFLLQYPPALTGVHLSISLTLHDCQSPVVLTNQQATITLTIS